MIFVVKGEAENTIPQLLEHLQAGRRHLIIENNIKPDITKSPVPRFDLLRLNKYAQFAIQTSRECPFECEFCDVIKMFGRKPRYKDPDQVIEALDTLLSTRSKRKNFVTKLAALYASMPLFLSLCYIKKLLIIREGIPTC